jgi:hypothetical protein
MDKKGGETAVPPFLHFWLRPEERVLIMQGNETHQLTVQEGKGREQGWQVAAIFRTIRGKPRDMTLYYYGSLERGLTGVLMSTVASVKAVNIVVLTPAKDGTFRVGEEMTPERQQQVAPLLKAVLPFIEGLSLLSWTLVLATQDSIPLLEQGRHP